MVKTLAAMMGTLALCAPLAGAAAAPTFTKKPTATKDGDQVRIAFAVDRQTDVAVYVEDANGKIVRHLVAGVLGKNAPAPFKPNSLEQSVTWDGRDDDGNRAAGGPFQVRVGLGLGAAYAGPAFAETGQTGPNKIERILGMTTGPDGTLYVLDGCGGWVWSTSKVLAFRRDGAYERSLKPFPSNLPLKKAQAAGAFTNSFGGFNPFIHSVQRFGFYPADDVAQQPAVTPEGQLVLAVSGVRLAVLDRDGGIPNSPYAGPVLGARLTYTKYPRLVASADSKTVYLTGLGTSKETSQAIYSVTLPDRGPAEVWFGDPAKPGSDKAHLNDVRGLAVDGKGHVLVADYGNNRVLVLNEKDASVAGSMAVPTPTSVAAGTTGAVYVQSGNAVIKFSGWEHATEQARLELPQLTGRNRSWIVALDASAEPAVVWAGRGVRLLRSEDQGTTFTEPAPAGCYPASLFWRPAADPTRREIAEKINYAPYKNKVVILNESTGAVRVFNTNKIAGIEGRSHRLGPDGALYGQDHAHQAGGIIRYDRNGRQKPFAATADDPYLKGRLPVGSTGTTSWERDFSVDRKGDIYVRARGPEYHGLMTVHVYDQEGRFKRIVLQMVSDGMYGPRVDPKGNLYILEVVKPQDRPFPEEFKAPLSGHPRAAGGYDWIYGSVVKFSPQGGAVWFSGRQATPLTYEGWGSGSSISGLRTTGGSLTGIIATQSAGLSFPSIRVDSAQYKTITVRLKNDSNGTEATLSYHHLKEGYIASCGPGYPKTIAIKPNSDFTEYTFDMTAEKEWNGIVHNFRLRPTNAAKGSFSIDWVRIGNAGRALVWNFDAEDGPEKKLPESLKKEQVGAYNRTGGATLQGALWWKPGFSPVGDLGVHNGCHCTGTDFDVDDFGRVFAPDTARFRVGVLDTNGNAIMSFGGYGNQDCCGPDSYVMDPAGTFLRPRRADDPKDLVSPFAKPEIAFGWIVGLAVTDRYAYVDDVINKRVLRVRLGYAAEETCPAP